MPNHFVRSIIFYGISSAWMNRLVMKDIFLVLSAQIFCSNGNKETYTHIPPHWSRNILQRAVWLATKKNTLRPRQNVHHFADDTLKRISLNKNYTITIEISLNSVPKRPINNVPSLVQIMAWCRPGGKPLSEPMVVTLLTHLCVTRPHWVKLRYCSWRRLLQRLDNFALKFPCNFPYVLLHLQDQKLSVWSNY